MVKTPPRFILSVGEPAGIGPDIVVNIAELELGCHISALIDIEVMDQRAQSLGSQLRCQEVSAGKWQFGNIKILPNEPDLEPLRAPVIAGKLDAANSAYVVGNIKKAAAVCLAGDYDAMITAPVHKGIINEAGVAFTGHTELIAEVCGGQKPVMMLANETLRVCLLTTHIALSKVAQSVNAELLSEVIGVIQHDCQTKLGLSKPRILVCGLNPHAGEDGHLGREEIDIMTPCLENLREQSLHIIGPVPADTAFAPHSLSQADVVLAMYHDQGLPAIKAQRFGEIVNITLGLPIIRTSVDHGTALDLAGTGKANESSLLAAIEQAKHMVQCAA